MSDPKPRCSATIPLGTRCERPCADESIFCDRHADFDASRTRQCTHIKEDGTGERCPQRAMSNTTLCADHGGKNYGAQKKARSVAVIRKARDAMVTFGVPAVGLDPVDALLEEIRRTAGHVRWIEEEIHKLDPEAVIWGRTTEESSLGDDPKSNYFLRKSEAVPSVWVSLYQVERKHLVDVCKAAIGAGIAERQVRIAEKESEMIASVLIRTGGDPELGLTADQQEVFKRIAARNIRVLSEESA